MRARSVALATKRTIDLAVSCAALVVAAPVIAWVAVAVLVTSGRPILFRQVRPGLHGQPFTIIKFRTMRSPAIGEVAHETDALRLTRIGGFLRSTSLDELPELWNVVKGEMSLVGPRPLLMAYLAHYDERQRRRHDMRPGITSWAAVNGRHSRPFDERIELDVWYVEHWSLGLDVRIMARTAAQLLRRTDVETTQDPASIGFPLDAGPAGGDRPEERA